MQSEEEEEGLRKGVGLEAELVAPVCPLSSALTAFSLLDIRFALIFLWTGSVHFLGRLS